MISWLIRRFRKLETIPDQIYIVRVKRGDKDAFGNLYMKYLDPIYRYIYFRVNQNREETEDLTEVVFFKAWENLKQFKDENINFRAWLYRVAHNAVIDHYRKQKNVIALDENIRTSVTVEEQYVQKDERDRLLSEIAKLTDEQKQVITLRFIDGLDNSEIGRILDKNEEAIRALSYRALKQLKKSLT